jgi:hypothetical protein
LASSFVENCVVEIADRPPVVVVGTSTRILALVQAQKGQDGQDDDDQADQINNPVHGEPPSLNLPRMLPYRTIGLPP